jgi:hypothetical protein
MRTHLRNKGILNKEVYDRVVKVFDKAGGSWVGLFQGSSDDLMLLKKILKIGIKQGVIPKKGEKKASLKEAGGKGLLDLFNSGIKVLIGRGSPHEFQVSLIFDEDSDPLDNVIFFSQREECEAYHITWVEAKNKGWGPFLYDIALEVVGKKGLTPGDSVRSGARKVWSYYYNNRSGIQRVPIENVEGCYNHYNQHELNSPLMYVYYKPRKTILKWLKKNDRIITKGGSIKISAAKSLSQRSGKVRFR